MPQHGSSLPLHAPNDNVPRIKECSLSYIVAISPTWFIYFIIFRFCEAEIEFLVFQRKYPLPSLGQKAIFGQMLAKYHPTTGNTHYAHTLEAFAQLGVEFDYLAGV